jgi:CRISPR-associated endonuclease/helicase Cas3
LEDCQHVCALMKPEFIAHTRPDLPASHWEPLRDHLNLVADGDDSNEGSAAFAETFGAKDWGRIAGLWHDLGKYSSAFQSYIELSALGEPVIRGSVDHSTAGALHADKRFGPHFGRLLAYTIAGHHAGLPDYIDTNGGRSGLAHRLKHPKPESLCAILHAPDWLKELDKPAIPGPLKISCESKDGLGLRMAFFVRMLFSCLVDADFLATEFYMDPSRSTKRSRDAIGIDRLLDALGEYMSRFTHVGEISPIDHVRAELLGACKDSSQLDQGLFTLTAPTGSGKTLSSLMFALMHAKRHGLRRVIYALPFTSITEQIADEFRTIFNHLSDQNSPVVLEHHSSAAWREIDEMESPTAFKAQLACENWDAELIVTTNVQLLESLFANRTSKCRKLHRLAQSVIIFDEAQALPTKLIKPTLIAIDELTRAYSTSIVLCSATMPAIIKRDDFPIGLTGVREIVPNPIRMAENMNRTQAHKLGPREDNELLDHIGEHLQSLTIVNTKGHSAALYQGLVERGGDDGVWHLSAAMCPSHRSRVLAQIRKDLTNGIRCQVVSTQVIEAGVDVDFPVVYRAIAGLDSIVQAAGRCNRNGKRPCSDVYIFDTDQAGKEIRRQAQSTQEISSIYDDLFSLEAIEHYFRLHLWQHNDQWDEHGISEPEMFNANSMIFQFRTAAQKYKVIDDQSQSIFVPYGEDGAAMVERLIGSVFPYRSLMRKLQRYSVSVPSWKYQKMLEAGVIEVVHEHATVLIDNAIYDEAVGLCFEDESSNPERLIY